ncbi:1,2-phenylacetyl-CoA epoxidase subunit PaaD [Ralstonia solanacearum]|uniref:1,2-phenylacetyl-CoA epoxidase subunit PaaD n=1 Tax=Ralstonia solanacearum TaxID=305 RepID=UPI0007C8BCB8|nr:1,2-phenylacetyl-CoA epoxidase subunit PaaD [Ralstonia solanacearum]RCW08392.1 phenylacetate-CoA oxygenase subunit PaaJ [Ralstonia solanacearum]
MVTTHPFSTGPRDPQADAARLARAVAALEAVTDPEIPVVTLAELGILRELCVDEHHVLVATITPTYCGCPAMSQIADDVSRALRSADVGAFRVETVLSPAWTTDWISEDGRRKLLDFGIAPPARRGTHNAACPIGLVRPEEAERVACPRCGSFDSERVSAFGTTACQAVYRCRACSESFGYFKPY